MAINERLIHTAAKAAGNKGQEGLILHLDAADDDSYDGDGSVWYDITDHEYVPTENPEEHFNTVLFSPTASGITSITGVGFQPDLVWTKNRSGTWWHQLYDSLRGGGNNLYPNGTNAEATPTSHLDSFDDDGFTVDYSENIGHNHVAWSFKAGGKPTATNTGGQTPTSGSKMVDGTSVTDDYPTADIYPTKQSVNTKLGFSITEYEGTLTSTQSDPGTSVPHGLGVPPELIIYKNKDTAAHWHVRVPFLGKNTVLKLNLTDDLNTLSSYPTGLPTANLVYTNYLTAENVDNYNYVMYAFASKRGVSKVGSYTGTGAAGNKVYTGFEPAWVMIKNTTTAGYNWNIMDNQRSDGDYLIAANTSATEVTNETPITFNSDGFTIDINGNYINKSGDTFIYLAFAKNTKETSLIDDTDLELHLDAGDSTTTSSNWDDLSSNTYGETITGTSYDKELGNWFSFGGNSDKVVIDDDGALTNNLNFTVEMWTYTQDNNDYRILWGNMNTSASARQVYCYIDNSDRLEFTTYYNNSSNAYRINRTNSVASKLHNKWVHLAFVLSGGKVSKIYINGEEEPITHTSGSDSQMHISSTIDFVVGNYHNSTQGTYGNIGQFRMYHTALTQAQIRQNYNFTKNDYPNGFNGDITGATWNSSGHFSFDGNDEIDLPDVGNVSALGTLSFWFKTNNSSGTGTIFGAGRTGNSNNYTWAPIYITSAGKLQYGYMANNGGWLNGAARETTATYNDDNWHHAVIVYSGTYGINQTHTLYVDGSEVTSTVDVGTQSASYLITDFSGKWSLGYYGAQDALYYTGNLSDVKVFSKKLTSAEVTVEYNKGQYGEN